MSGDLMKIRLISGAFIAGALYLDPLTPYVGSGPIGMAIEGGIAGLIGGDIAQAMTPETGGSFQLFSIYGKGYAVGGALAGLASSFLGLNPLYSAALGAASTFLDTMIISWEGKVF